MKVIYEKDYTPIIGVLYGITCVSTVIAMMTFLDNRESKKRPLPQKNSYPIHAKNIDSTDLQDGFKQKESRAIEHATRVSHEKKYRVAMMMLGIFFLLIAMLTVFFFGVAKVSGSSMQPTFNNGDYVFYKKLFDEVHTGNIILFEKNGKKYIKRIYGTPGDSVEITQNGTVLINGFPLVLENLLTIGITEPRDIKRKIILGEDEYFVLGDHRSVSLDSRNQGIGMVSQKEIIGIYLFSIQK